MNQSRFSGLQDFAAHFFRRQLRCKALVCGFWDSAASIHSFGDLGLPPVVVSRHSLLELSASHFRTNHTLEGAQLEGESVLFGLWHSTASSPFGVWDLAPVFVKQSLRSESCFPQPLNPCRFSNSRNRLALLEFLLLKQLTNFRV